MAKHLLNKSYQDDSKLYYKPERDFSVPYALLMYRRLKTSLLVYEPFLEL